jgi:S1/P1 Nuclease
MATATKVLKMNLLNNTAERALFARYVVHLVGDIHQPLHSVALFNKTYPKGDLGGNTHKVILTNGSTSNFHSYWDAGAYILQNDTWFITRPMNMQNLTALKDVAYSMIAQYGK